MCVRRLCRYGQPRVGNPAFANAFADSIGEYRVVHYADIVPHLPPELLGFQHVPTEVCVCVDMCAGRALCVATVCFDVCVRVYVCLCWQDCVCVWMSRVCVRVYLCT